MSINNTDGNSWDTYCYGQILEIGQIRDRQFIDSIAKLSFRRSRANCDLHGSAGYTFWPEAVLRL